MNLCQRAPFKITEQDRDFLRAPEAGWRAVADVLQKSVKSGGTGAVGFVALSGCPATESLNDVNTASPAAAKSTSRWPANSETLSARALVTGLDIRPFTVKSM